MSTLLQTISRSSSLLSSRSKKQHTRVQSLKNETHTKVLFQKNHNCEKEKHIWFHMKNQGREEEDDDEGAEECGRGAHKSNGRGSLDGKRMP